MTLINKELACVPRERRAELWEACVRARTADRAQRFASESARVCFQDEWQPVRSRRCVNECCAAKSNPSVVEFRKITIESVSMQIWTHWSILSRLNHIILNTVNCTC